MPATKLGNWKKLARKLGVSLDVITANVQAGLKWCYRCARWRPVCEFSTDRSRWDGRKAKCRECDYVRRSPGPGKSERIAKKKQGLAWCRGCKAWLSVGEMQRQGACTKCLSAETKERYKTDPQTRLRVIQTVYARRRQTQIIPPELYRRIITETNGRCVYCGTQAAALDHLIPVVTGGTSEENNLVPACRRCNSSKNDSNVFLWLVRKNITPHHFFYQQMDRLLEASSGSNIN